VGHRQQVTMRPGEYKYPALAVPRELVVRLGWRVTNRRQQSRDGFLARRRPQVPRLMLRDEIEITGVENIRRGGDLHPQMGPVPLERHFLGKDPVTSEGRRGARVNRARDRQANADPLH
jgi:hypothetical protein